MANEKLKNRVKQTCTGSGTGDLNIAAGAAAAGFRKVTDAYSIGESGVFVLESGTDYEIFYGTRTNSSTLARSTVIESSNANNKIELVGTNVHLVYCDLDANGYVFVDQTGIARPGKAILRASTVNTLADLTSVGGALGAGDSGVVYLMLGTDAQNDGAGGLFRWNGTAWDRLFLRKILKTGNAAGGDPTPDVSKVDIVVTAGTTAITNFINGTVGQLIYVVRGASDIVIQDNANIDLGGQSIQLSENLPTVALLRVTEGSATVWKLAGGVGNAALNTRTHWLIKDRSLITPPGGLTFGDAYLMPASGTLLGAWSGFSNNNIAVYNTSGWVQHVPVEGWTVDILDEDLTLRHDGSGWVYYAEQTKPAVKFSDSDASPSVAATRVFTCADTAPAAITNLDDMENGRIVIVRPGLQDQVFQHSASFVMPSGVNFTLATDSAPVQFFKINDTIYLLGGGGGGSGSVTATGASTAITAEDRAALYMTPMDFGAVGGGNDAADRTGLAASMPYVFQRGEILNGVGRTYKISAGAGLAPTLGSGKFVRLRDCVIDVSAVNSTSSVGTAGYWSDRVGLLLQGAYDGGGKDFMDAAYVPKTTLTAQANRFADSLTVADTTGFVKGDVVLIHATTNWDQTATGKLSDSHVVRGVPNGTTLQLEAGLRSTIPNGATVRKYPNNEIVLENVKIIGAGASQGQNGVVVANAKRFVADNLVVENCEERALLVVNCFSADVDNYEAIGADIAGLGYGIVAAGVHDMHIGSMSVVHSRHGFASGAGASGNAPMCRNIRIDSIRAYGQTNAAINAHPAVDKLHVGYCYATYAKADANADGDLALIQSAHFSCDEIEAHGVTRHGFSLQPAGYGDGELPIYSIGKARIVGDSSTSQYPVIFDDAAAAGAYPFGKLSFEMLDAKFRYGIQIMARENDIDFFEIHSGKVDPTTAVAITLKTINTANGRIKNIMIGPVYLKSTGAASSGIFNVNVQGASGSITDRALFLGTTFDGGDYGIATEHAATKVVAPRYISPGRGSHIEGTGGTYSEVDSGGGGGGGSAVGENVLINGDLQINQRGFAGGVLAAGTYGYDRWKGAAGGADLTRSGYTITLSSGELEQIVEPGRFGYASFASQSITVSVDAPSQNLTVTFGSQSGTITAGSGRQSVTLSMGAGDTGNLSFKIKRATAGSVTFGRIKVEVGATATGWSQRPHEAILCRIYYEQFRAQILGYNVAGASVGTGVAWQSKRTTPTLTRLANNVAFTEQNCGTGPSTSTGGTVNGTLLYRTAAADGAVQFSETWEASAEL